MTGQEERSGSPVNPGDQFIWDLGFPEWREVTGRPSVADLFPVSARCGLYVLGFANGERYVGQAVDVVRRYTGHRKVHDDITHLSFREVPKAELDDQERRSIHALEAQGLRLRNVVHMSVVQGERDLDLVISPQEQEQWLTGDVTGLQDAEQGIQDNALRARYHRRFEQFMGQPQAEDALFLLGLYLQSVIPFPRRTELTFWAATCLPDTGAPECSVLLYRVSLNMQEVFSLYGHAGDDENELWAEFHLARSPFQEAFGDDWQGQLQARGWDIDDHQYRPGGQDQFRLTAHSFEDLKTLLLDSGYAGAMALINLRLMRLGATYYSRYHCLDLVDAALKTLDERRDELTTKGKSMSDTGIPGLLHIGDQVAPAGFDPSSWTVVASLEPEVVAALTDPAQEYPVRFESARTGGGSVTAFARFLTDDPQPQYHLYLKSLLDED